MKFFYILSDRGAVISEILLLLERRKYKELWREGKLWLPIQHIKGTTPGVCICGFEDGHNDLSHEKFVELVNAYTKILLDQSQHPCHLVWGELGVGISDFALLPKEAK